MIRMAFSIRCQGCGYVFRPSRSPREGIQKVLRGEVISCENCGGIFRKIILPARPLVLETAMAEGVPSFVAIRKYNSGVPKALGCV